MLTTYLLYYILYKKSTVHQLKYKSKISTPHKGTGRHKSITEKVL